MMMAFQSFWFVNRFIEIFPNCSGEGAVVRFVLETGKINLPRKKSQIVFLKNKKRKGGLVVYFRFLSSQNAAAPIIAPTASAAMMAISVVMNGVSVVGTVGSVASGVVGSGVVSSGSNACENVDSVTPMAVCAYEL